MSSNPTSRTKFLWGYSSAGRAVALQAKGHRFDPVYLHQTFMKRTWVDVKERPCDGCTKCCEGYLVTTVLGVALNPSHPCKFIKKNVGCSVHLARPFDPCKMFQCHWKENTKIPEWLKPDKVNAILLLRSLEEFNYIRIVKAGLKQDPKIYLWAEEQSKNGRNIVAYDDLGKLLVYSQDEKFIELARKKL